MRQRTQSNSLGYSGLDGSGVGIAIVDSGVMWKHQVMNDAQGKTRVKRSVDFLQVGDVAAVGAKDWTPGVDVDAAMYPGSPTLDFYESMIDSTGNYFSDDYGHGTHVAAIAAGRDFKQQLDTTGIAPNADVFDVRVLDEQGFGQLSDVLAGIDWVIFHARQYNIRVMNLSLAADSTDSVLNDPLARAVRSATAAGITVVVAAGNFGQSADGAEVYGSIGSPGNEPSAITVGSSHMHATLARGDDSVNFFSSRGPTRGGLFDASGLRVHDDLIKPDLVAPGNKIVGALATDNDSMQTHNRLAALYPALAAVPGANQQQGVSVMMMSGTSVSAPVVSGAVALMLQANPGLTPPLIKAILQYSAQALPRHNLMQQGAGLLNIDGAVRLAKALRQDVGSAVLAGSIAAGAPMLAEGASLPVPSSTVNGVTFPWGRIVTVGGAHLVSGDALFTAYQPIYDPRLAWFKGNVQRSGVTYWPASQGFAANTYVRSILRTATSDQVFLTPGVVDVTALAGESSSLGRTGLFMPTATLAGWLDAGSGVRLRRGIVLSEGLVISEGLVMSEGLRIKKGIVLSESVVMSEGLVLSEGLVMSETGQPSVQRSNDRSLLGEP